MAACPVALATSEHPVAAHAVAECAGALLERTDQHFDELLVMVGAPFDGALEDITGALAQLLGVRQCAGLVGRGLLMGTRIGVDTPGLVVLAVRSEYPLVGHVGSPRALLDLWQEPAGRHDATATRASSGPAPVSLLLADPFSVDLAAWRAELASPRRGCPTPLLASGYIGARGGPGTTRFRASGSEYRDGALALLLPNDLARLTEVHGTAAVGDAVRVTTVDRNDVIALDDLPAAEVFEASLARPTELPAGVDRVGFLRTGSPELVAARRSPKGLVLERPVELGELLVPAVRSVDLVASEIRGAMSESSRDVALVFSDSDLPAGPTRPLDVAAERLAVTAGLELSQLALDGPPASGRTQEAGRAEPASASPGGGAAALVLTLFGSG